MVAAVILISVLTLAGACFPGTPPCISNLRQRTLATATGTKRMSFRDLKSVCLAPSESHNSL